jgi:hypothetical protein
MLFKDIFKASNLDLRIATSNAIHSLIGIATIVAFLFISFRIFLNFLKYITSLNFQNYISHKIYFENFY